MRLSKIFPTPALLVLGFPLIWACEDSVTGPPSEDLDAETRMVLRPRVADLAVGESIQLRPQFFSQLPFEADGHDDEEWVSSDTSVADVYPGGIVYGVSPGQVVIDLYRGPFHATARIVVTGEGTGNDPPLDRHGVRHRAP